MMMIKFMKQMRSPRNSELILSSQDRWVLTVSISIKFAFLIFQRRNRNHHGVDKMYFLFNWIKLRLIGLLKCLMLIEFGHQVYMDYIKELDLS